MNTSTHSFLSRLEAEIQKQEVYWNTVHNILKPIFDNKKNSFHSNQIYVFVDLTLLNILTLNPPPHPRPFTPTFHPDFN